MLSDLIVGAFTFRRDVYAKVEKDSSFTNTAWLLVTVVSLLNQLGSNAGRPFFRWLMGSIIGTVFAVVGFGLACFVIAWVAKALFNANVTFEELIRTLGLAYVWQVVGFLGVLKILGPLACLAVPVMILAWIAGVAAWLIAAKEAIDLDWAQTIVSVVVGVVVLGVVWGISAAIIGIIGFGAAAATAALR